MSPARRNRKWHGMHARQFCLMQYGSQTACLKCSKAIPETQHRSRRAACSTYLGIGPQLGILAAAGALVDALNAWPEQGGWGLRCHGAAAAPH